VTWQSEAAAAISPADVVVARLLADDAPILVSDVEALAVGTLATMLTLRKAVLRRASKMTSIGCR